MTELAKVLLAAEEVTRCVNAMRDNLEEGEKRAMLGADESADIDSQGAKSSKNARHPVPFRA